MITLNRKPVIVLVSAPSGAGKTTLCNRLLGEFPELFFVVTCTTREPREGEVHGRSYYFLDRDDFESKLEAGEFLEHAMVHGNYYGTLKREVMKGLKVGRSILMNVDVQGAESIRTYLQRTDLEDLLKTTLIDVFIAPPSIRDLQTRLFGRGKDEEEVIRRRLAKAKEEMARWREYSYIIVNDKLDESYDVLRAVFLAEQHAIKNIQP